LWRRGTQDGDYDFFATTACASHKNTLFRYEGGVFQITTNNPMYMETHVSQQCLWADYNGDGLIDLLVNSQEQGGSALLYTNNGGGSFTKVLSGEVLSSSGALGRWHTFDYQDFDGDGYGDLVMVGTGSASEQLKLLRNIANDGYQKEADSAAAQGAKASHASAFGDISARRAECRLMNAAVERFTQTPRCSHVCP
jgi:hypothetical protein